MGKEHLVSIVLRNNSSEGQEKNKALVQRKSVVYKEITESEYEQLSKQISVQKQQEMEELKQEVGNLKQMLAQQNILIQ